MCVLRVRIAECSHGEPDESDWAEGFGMVTLWLREKADIVKAR